MRAGMAHSRLDEIEKGIDSHSGKAFHASYQTVVGLAKAYGLPPDELLRRAGHEPGIELEQEEWEIVREYRLLAPEDRQALRTFLLTLRGK